MASTNLPTDPDQLWIALEPMFAKLSSGSPEFEATRAKLPAAKSTMKRARALTIEDALVVAGSLSVTDGLTLAANASLVVLGDLTVRGGLWSEPYAFSVVVAGGVLDVDRAHTSGEALAFGGVRATLWWGLGNDHSTYAPTLDGEVYVASRDRGDIIPSLTAATQIVGFDVREELAKRFPTLDTEDAAAVRAFIGGATAKAFRPTPAKDGELAQLREELAAAWSMTERQPKVGAIRAIYAGIAKRRLADAGPLLLEMIARKRAEGADGNWSLQDELELLAKLRRADLIEAIPAQHLVGYEGWIPGLLAEARGNGSRRGR